MNKKRYLHPGREPFLWLWLGLLSLTSLTAQAQLRTYHLALIVPNDNTYFWQAMHAGAIKAQKELSNDKVRVQLSWEAPHDPDNLQQQIDLVGDAVGSGVDAIGLAALDPEALVPPVELAGRQKIPVVSLEFPLDYPLLTSTVATSNYRCGSEAAIVMGKLLKQRGRVLVIRHLNSNIICMKRENGFLDGVGRYDDSLEVLAPDEFVGKTEEEAYQLTKKFLKQYANQIGGLFTSDPESTKGAHRALVESGLSDRIVHVGYLVGEDALTAMKSGALQGVIAPAPFDLGYLSVRVLFEATKGHPITARVEVPNATLTPDNFSDPKIQAMLTPPLQDYLPLPPKISQ